MKITTAKLKQIIKEELMREMGDVVHMFPYKVMTNASGAPAQFKDLDAAIATAQAWEESGILVPEGTSDEVLDVIYRDRRYEDEERDIKRAGPSPQMTPEEHEDYMALYDEEDIEPLEEVLDPESMTVIQGFIQIIDNLGVAAYPAIVGLAGMAGKEVLDAVKQRMNEKDPRGLMRDPANRPGGG